MRNENYYQMMKNFIKVIYKNSVGSLCLKERFPTLRETKRKEDRMRKMRK